MSPSTLPKKFLSHLQLLLTLPLFYRTHPWRYLQGAIGMAIIGKPHPSLSRSQTKTYGVCDFETIEFQVHWQFTFKVCNIHQCFPSSGPTSEIHLPVKLKQKLVPKLQHTTGIPINDFFGGIIYPSGLFRIRKWKCDQEMMQTNGKFFSIFALQCL